MYEMRLFDIALKYAEVAIKIDPNFTKAYFRKLNSLLEMHIYESSSMCLLKLFSLMKAEDFEPLNAKYINYVSNNAGIFNWIDIKNNKSFYNTMGDYVSEKLALEG